MRVLHFGRFYDDNYGGMERHVAVLLDSLKDEIEVANVVANDRFRFEVTRERGYPIYKVPSLGLAAGMALCPTMPFVLRDIHRRTPIDIVHLHFPDPMSHFASGVLPATVKRVVTWHSDIVRQRRLLALYRPFLDAFLRRADGVILPTPAHRFSSTQLNAVTDASRFHCVPFGFDLSQFQERPAEADALRERYSGRSLVFALGRHVYYKGFEFLIEAMRSLPQAVLVLGGQGPLTETLRRLASGSGLGERVDFVGRIPEERLAAYYHACDVFCMPSVERSEAFGIVQVEAMACGRPVVSCELGNGVNYVNRHGETGLVVPPRDARALAAAIGALLGDPELAQRLGAQARARVASEFTLRAMRFGTLAVYRELLPE